MQSETNYDWNQYQTDALVTVVDVPGIGGAVCPALVYRTMGLCGEMAELAEATDTKNMIAEVGDVLWYMATVADELNIPMDSLEPGDMSAVTAALKLGNVVKKVYRDNNGVVSDAAHAKIKNLIGCVFYGIGDDETRRQAADYNIKKLRDRLRRKALHGDGDNR